MKTQVRDQRKDMLFYSQEQSMESQDSTWAKIELYSKGATLLRLQLTLSLIQWSGNVLVAILNESTTNGKK